MKAFKNIPLVILSLFFFVTSCKYVKPDANDKTPATLKIFKLEKNAADELTENDISNTNSLDIGPNDKFWILIIASDASGIASQVAQLQMKCRTTGGSFNILDFQPFKSNTYRPNSNGEFPMTSTQVVDIVATELHSVIRSANCTPSIAPNAFLSMTVMDSKGNRTIKTIQLNVSALLSLP